MYSTDEEAAVVSFFGGRWASNHLLISPYLDWVVKKAVVFFLPKLFGFPSHGDGFSVLSLYQ